MLFVFLLVFFLLVCCVCVVLFCCVVLLCCRLLLWWLLVWTPLRRKFRFFFFPLRPLALTVASGLHTTTRELHTCTSDGPGTSKHHQKTTRRPPERKKDTRRPPERRNKTREDTEREQGTNFAAGEGKKKREIFSPPPSCPPQSHLRSRPTKTPPKFHEKTPRERNQDTRRHQVRAQSGRRVGGQEGGGPKISRFFCPLPLPFSLFLALWGSSRGILVVFWSVGTLKCAHLGSLVVVWAQSLVNHQHDLCVVLSLILLVALSLVRYLCTLLKAEPAHVPHDQIPPASARTVSHNLPKCTKRHQ